MEEDRSEVEQSKRLQHLRQAMYSRSISPKLHMRARRELNELPTDIPEDWEKKVDPVSSSRIAPRVIGATRSVLTWVLGLSAIFFVASIGIFLYYFVFGAGNLVAAPENIDILVRGPSTIQGGQAAELQIVVTNRNNATLELADLIVTYPKGTRSPADFTTDLPQQRVSLGAIEPGGRRQGTVSAVFLGSENASLTAHVELEYRTVNSSAIYAAQSDYMFALASAPVSIAIEANDEAVAGQPLLLTATVRANADTLVKDVVLEASYPFGFKFDYSEPETKNGVFWELGDLRPGEERIIRVRGILEGQESDERLFTLRAGTRRNKDSKAIDYLVAESTHRLAIAKPFIGLGIAVNKETGDNAAVSKVGETVNVTVSYVNNLGTPISNAVIVARLTGLKLDDTSIRTIDGFYRSSDRTVLWDKTTTRGVLSDLAPGARGTLNFSFEMPNEEVALELREAQVDIAIHAAGKRVGDAGVPETLQTVRSRTIKLASNTHLLAQGFYYSNPFGSVGPLPPKVNEETTYAVAFTIANTSNKITGGVLKAELPPYVRWLGVYSPSSERLVFNTSDGSIEWNVGDVAQGVGVKSAPPRQVVLAVGLTPSASQIGSQPELVRGITFTGKDAFTSAPIELKAGAVNTNLLDDPGFSTAEAKVISNIEVSTGQQ